MPEAPKTHLWHVELREQVINSIFTDKTGQKYLIDRPVETRTSLGFQGGNGRTGNEGTIRIHVLNKANLRFYCLDPWENDGGAARTCRGKQGEKEDSSRGFQDFGGFLGDFYSNKGGEGGRNFQFVFSLMKALIS